MSSSSKHPASHQKGGVGLAPLGHVDARSKAGASPRNTVAVPKTLFPPKGSSTGSINTRPKSNQPPVRSRTPVQQQNDGASQSRTPTTNQIPRAPPTPPPNQRNVAGRSQHHTSSEPSTKPTQVVSNAGQQQSPQRARPTAQSQSQQTPTRDQIMNLADYTTPSPLHKRTNALREKLDRFLSPQTPVQAGGSGRYGGAPPPTASSVASSSDGMTPSRRQQQEWLEILNYIDSVTIAVSSHNKTAPELPGKSLTGVGAGHIGTEMGAPISLVGSKAVVGPSSSSPSTGNYNSNKGGRAPRVKPSTIDASKYLATIQRHINGLLHWFSLLELKSLPRGSNTVSEILRNQLLLSSDSIAAIGAAQAYILQEAGADGGTQLLQFMKLQIAPVVSECYDSICSLYGLAKGYGEIRQAVQERDGELALKVIRASKATESRKNSKVFPPPSIKGPKVSPLSSPSAQITNADSVANKLPSTPVSYPPTLVEWLEMKWHPALEQWNSILSTAKKTFASPEADRDHIASTVSKLKGDVLNDPINTSLFQELLLPGETLPKLVSEHITSPGDGAAMAATKKASLFKRLMGAVSSGKNADSGPNFVELASAVRAIQDAYPEPSTGATLETIRSNPTGCDPSKLSTSELKQVEDAQRLLLNIQHAGKATMALTIALNGGPGSIEPLIRAMTEANRIMLKLGVCGAGDGSKTSTARCLKAIQQGEDMIVALGRTNPDSVDGSTLDQVARHARRQQLADQRRAFLTAFSAGDLIVVHLPGSGWSPELTMMYQKAGEAIAKSLERELIKLDAAKQLSKYSKQPTPRHDSHPRAGSTATDLAGVGGGESIAHYRDGGGRSASPPTTIPTGGGGGDGLRRVSIGSTSSSRPGTQTTTIAIEDLRALVSRSKHAGLENTQELLQIQRMVDSAMELRFKVHFDSNIRLLSVPQEQVVSSVSEARNAVSAGGGAGPGASGRISSVGNNKRGSSPSVANNKRSNSRPQSGGDRVPATNPTAHRHNAHHYAPPSFDRLFDKIFRFCIQGLTGPSAQTTPTQLPPDHELATPQTVNFRMRYQDTEGDFILLTSEEDWKVLLSDHYSGAYHQVAAAAGRAGGKTGAHHQRIELYCDIPAQPRQGPTGGSGGVSTPTGASPGQQQHLLPRPSNSGGGGNKIVRNGFVPTTTPLKANGINVLNHAPTPYENAGVAVEYHGPRRSSSSHGSAAGKGAIDTGKIKGPLSKGIQGTQLLPTSNNNRIQGDGTGGGVRVDSYYQNGEEEDPEFQLPAELPTPREDNSVAPAQPPYRGESPIVGAGVNNRKFSFTVASAPTSKQHRGGSNAKSHDDASSASSKPSPSRPAAAVVAVVARSAEDGVVGSGNRGTWADPHRNGGGDDDELDLHTVLSDKTDTNPNASPARESSPSLRKVPVSAGSGGRSGSSTTRTAIPPPLYSTNTVNLLGGKKKSPGGGAPLINAWSDRHVEDDTLELHTVLSERTGGDESSSSPSRLVPPPRQRATSSSVSPPMSTGTVKLVVGGGGGSKNTGGGQRGSAWVSNDDDDNDFDLHTITSEVSSELQKIGDRRRQILVDAQQSQQKTTTAATALPVSSSSASKKQPLQAPLPTSKKTSSSSSAAYAPPTEAQPQQQRQQQGGLRESDFGALRPKTWVDDHAENVDFDLHTVASIETTGTQAWRKDILAQAIEVEAELQRMEKNARGGWANGNKGGAPTSSTAAKKGNGVSGGPSEAPPVNIRTNIPVPGIPLASNHPPPKRQQHQQDAYTFPTKNVGESPSSSSSSPAIHLAVQGKHPDSGTANTAAEGNNSSGSSPPKKKKLSMAEVNTRRAELLAQIRKQKQEQDAAATASK